MTFILACLITGSPVQNRCTEISPFNLGPRAQKLFLHITFSMKLIDIVNALECRPVSESLLTGGCILFSDSLCFIGTSLKLYL